MLLLSMIDSGRGKKPFLDISKGDTVSFGNDESDVDRTVVARDKMCLKVMSILKLMIYLF
jgi:hypothetical protein